MSFFNDSVPPLRRKRAALDIQDLEGLWQVNWYIGHIKLYSTYYTRIDQAFILWGLLLIPMFVTAQFFPLNWGLQAGLWSVLSCIGTTVMMNWSSYWVKRRQVEWVLYCWVFLMLVGVILTNLGIIFSWGEILLNLCPMWLGLSALGYLCTGFAVRSRTILFTGVIHAIAIFYYPTLSHGNFSLQVH